jgi:hypothetical protein
MYALIVDGSALFFAIRDLFTDAQLDYEKLVAHVEKAVGEKMELKVFYTAHSPSNSGQARFLSYLEETGWTVRKQHVANVGLVDQRTMALISSGPIRDRLTRFDAQLAYMVGDLASQDYGIVAITDSFSLAEPLFRTQRVSGLTSYIAFFDTLLDPRWASIGVERIVLNDLILGNTASDFTWAADAAETE